MTATPAHAQRLAPGTDVPLTYFTSPRGETCSLAEGKGSAWLTRRTSHIAQTSCFNSRDPYPSGPLCAAGHRRITRCSVRFGAAAAQKVLGVEGRFRYSRR